MRVYQPQRTRDEAIDRNLDKIAAVLDDLTKLPVASGWLSTKAQISTKDEAITSGSVFCRASAATTLTLPGVLSLGNGEAQWIAVVNDSAFAVTIAVVQGDSLSGSATVAAGVKALFVSDGANKWSRVV